jgi:hypothetical protein
MSEKTSAQRIDGAFHEGMAAFFKHDRSVDGSKHNPWPSGSTEWEAWEQGYDAASDGAWDAWKSGF